MDGSEPLHPALRGLKTVCRCNNVKYRTIERAIRDGARTTAEVAARTTATTGYCGGTCTPEVQQMIEELAPAVRSPGPLRPPQQTPRPAAAAPQNAEWWMRKK